MSLRIQPNGRFYLQSEELPSELLSVFSKGLGPGILHLGAVGRPSGLSADLIWIRELCSLFISRICASPEAAEATFRSALWVPLPADAAERLLREAPPLRGGEYLSLESLEALWSELAVALRTALMEADQPLAAWLSAKNPAWNQVGRVCFHLAENRSDPEKPFAFLATYTPQLSASSTAAVHRPLGRALREYSEAGDREGLLALLTPVYKAAQACTWLAPLVDRGEIFHPLRWTPSEAMALLQDLPALEASGVVLRMPVGWANRRPGRPRVAAQVGAKPPSKLGAAALLDFSVDMSLDGESLTPEEWKALLQGTAGLRLLRGRWVEVDPEQLTKTMDRLEALQHQAEQGGLSFAEAARLLAGLEDSQPDKPEIAWGGIAAGPWLAEVMAELRNPTAALEPGSELHATLRPYQKRGLQWMYLLHRLGLGGCLADDMGLGKTIQVLSLYLLLAKTPHPTPHLLVLPASLLGNWMNEAARFAPGLRLFVAHSSVRPAGKLRAAPANWEGIDVVLTTYGSLSKLKWLEEVPWRSVILDEAQAIKNAGTRQTKAAKAMKSSWRLALTGTPVENRLGDLWSLFDFLNPGLLGSARSFGALSKKMTEQGHFGPLRELVRPYILRRLKTDKSVISDLPDKIEVTAFCGLSKKQAAMYQEAVQELAQKLAELDGIQRRGVVLAFLMRFKQICNHPLHYLGGGTEWEEGESGKFERLRELCDIIAEKQEKVLVFSQFRETTQPLSDFLSGVFGRPGLILHGDTAIKDRQKLVKEFQEGEAPFFVLSLKAGGTGLNLTAANHVIHFDRWWNPAVENQATDRAFRIGQHRNVMVHKLVCRGTLEEKIDAMIQSKQALANELLEGSGELQLTELNNEELLRMISLDIHRATGQ